MESARLRQSIEAYIKCNWKANTVEMMTDRINELLEREYSVASIRKYAKQMGIEPISPKDLKVAFILDNHKFLTISEIASHLNCSIGNINIIFEEYELAECSPKQIDFEIVSTMLKEGDIGSNFPKQLTGGWETASPEVLEYVQGILPNKKIERPPAIYTQTGSPYGIAF